MRALATSGVAGTEGAVGGHWHPGIIEIQRARLLAATVSLLDEQGYPSTTVAHITGRARVSRRTFYELFANRERCLTAVLDDVEARVAKELEVAGVPGLAWRERVRGGLWVILSFLDREPALARVCVLQSALGGIEVQARRERILARLAQAIDAGREQCSRAATCSPLTAEGLVGAALAIVHARLAHGEGAPLTGLVGELMGLIVLPYLGPAPARREQKRTGAPLLPGVRAARPVPLAAAHPLQDVPMRLTYRTVRVLDAVARHPRASNRVVAEQAEIHDQGQVSKLLARLERIGLLANGGDGHSTGKPNEWRLTPQGEQVARSVGLQTDGEPRV